MSFQNRGINAKTQKVKDYYKKHIKPIVFQKPGDGHIRVFERGGAGSAQLDNPPAVSYKPAMPKVTFMPLGQSFEVEDGTTILVAAIRNGVKLRHDCTEAICGTDKVKILAGQNNLSPMDDNEELTLSMLESDAADRLGCVAKVLGDVIVEIPAE